MTALGPGGVTGGQHSRDDHGTFQSAPPLLRNLESDTFLLLRWACSTSVADARTDGQIYSNNSKTTTDVLLVS